MKIQIRLAPKVWGTVGGCRLSERSSCRYDADRTLFLLYFKGTGCQAPLELDTHQIKSTTSDFDFRRV